MNRTRVNIFIQLSNILPRLPSHMQKRWAGHSKWQNIKSTKEALDKKRSLNFSKIRQKIILALKDGDNPSVNSKLKFALEEAKKNMMPKETIQNIFKKTLQKEQTEPSWVFFTNSIGIILAFEILTNDMPSVQKMSQYLKKINFKHEKHVLNLCNLKGLIIAEPLQNNENSYDKAIEDGIEAGVSEVTQDEDKLLYFECDSEFIQGSSKKLEQLGYNIQSASTEIEFFNFIKVKNDEIKRIEDGIKRLEQFFFDIIRMTNNITKEE